MKFECLREHLLDAVSKTEKIASKSSALPVLKCILIDVQKNSASIKATNLDVGVECSVVVKSSEEGSIAVPGSLLAGFLSTISDSKNVTLESSNEGELKVYTENSQTTLKTLPVDDFPELPKTENVQGVDLDSSILIDGLKAVWYSSATTSIKPELSSVKVYQEAGDLVFVATDGFRLAEKKVKTKGDIGVSQILIPVKNVGEIIKLIDGVDESVGLVIDQGLIQVSVAGMRVVSRTIDGMFPDYQQIIPKEFVTEMKVLKQDLNNVLRLSNIFSDTYYQVIFDIKVEDGSFSVSSKNKDLGEHETKVKGQVSGEDLNIQFNFKYLSDCLSSIKSDTVKFSFAGKGRPIVVSGGGDTSFLYLMMPMNG